MSECPIFKPKEVYAKCRYCDFYKIRNYRPYCLWKQKFIDKMSVEELRSAIGKRVLRVGCKK